MKKYVAIIMSLSIAFSDISVYNIMAEENYEMSEESNYDIESASSEDENIIEDEDDSNVDKEEEDKKEDKSNDNDKQDISKDDEEKDGDSSFNKNGSDEAPKDIEDTEDNPDKTIEGELDSEEFEDDSSFEDMQDEVYEEVSGIEDDTVSGDEIEQEILGSGGEKTADQYLAEGYCDSVGDEWVYDPDETGATLVEQLDDIKDPDISSFVPFSIKYYSDGTLVINGPTEDESQATIDANLLEDFANTYGADVKSIYFMSNISSTKNCFSKQFPNMEYVYFNHGLKSVGSNFYNPTFVAPTYEPRYILKEVSGNTLDQFETVAYDLEKYVWGAKSDGSLWRVPLSDIKKEPVEEPYVMFNQRNIASNAYCWKNCISYYNNYEDSGYYAAYLMPGTDSNYSKETAFGHMDADEEGFCNADHNFDHYDVIYNTATDKYYSFEDYYESRNILSASTVSPRYPFCISLTSKGKVHYSLYFDDMESNTPHQNTNVIKIKGDGKSIIYDYLEFNYPFEIYSGYMKRPGSDRLLYAKADKNSDNRYEICYQPNINAFDEEVISSYRKKYTINNEKIAASPIDVQICTVDKLRKNSFQYNAEGSKIFIAGSEAGLTVFSESYGAENNYKRDYAIDWDLSDNIEMTMFDKYLFVNNNGDRKLYEMTYELTESDPGNTPGKLKFIGFNDDITNASNAFHGSYALEGHFIIPKTLMSAGSMLQDTKINEITAYTGTLLYSPLVPSTITPGSGIYIEKYHILDGDTVPGNFGMTLYAGNNYYKGLNDIEFDVQAHITQTSQGCMYDDSNGVEWSVHFEHPEIITNTSNMYGRSKLKAFNLCDMSSLTQITPPGFQGCTNLRDFGCGKEGLLDMSKMTSLVRLGASTFNACYGIEEIRFPDKGPITAETPLPTMYLEGGGAFTNCINLRTLDLTNAHGIRFGENTFMHSHIENDLIFPRDVAGIASNMIDIYFGRHIEIPVTCLGYSANDIQGAVQKAPNLETMTYTVGSDILSSEPTVYVSREPHPSLGGSYYIGSTTGGTQWSTEVTYSSPYETTTYPGNKNVIYIFEDGITALGDEDHVSGGAGWGLAGTGGWYKQVVLPDTVEYIGDFAFAESLEEINVPANLRHISYMAFQNTKIHGDFKFPSTLTRVEPFILNGVQTKHTLDFSDCVNLTEFDQQALCQDRGLEDVILPPNLTKIKNYAFYGCTSLHDLIMPDSVTEVGDAIGSKYYKYSLYYNDKDNWYEGGTLFDGKLKLSEGLFTDGSLNDIMSNEDKWRWLKESNFKTLEIPITALSPDDDFNKYMPPTLETLILTPGSGDGMMFDSHGTPDDIFHDLFRNIDGGGTVIIEDGIQSIGDYAFASANIKAVDLSHNHTLKSIGIGAFMDCEFLGGEMIIPDSIEYIGEDAFTNTALETVSIPVSVLPKYNQVGSIFRECDELHNYIFTKGKDGVWPDLPGEDDWVNAPLSLDKRGSITIKPGVKNIGKYALLNARNMVTLTMPVGIDIDMTSFDDDNTIQKVVLTDNVSENNIPNSTKENYKRYPWNKCSLNKVTVDLSKLSNLESIGDYTFYDGDNVYTTLPESVKHVGDFAFYDNTNQSLSLFDMRNLESVGNSAFYRCTTLPAVVDLSEVATIGDESYIYCPNITGIYISTKLVHNDYDADDPNLNNISYSVQNGYAIYDGTETDGGACVTVSGNYTNLSLKYGNTKSDINMTNVPKFSSIGTHTVYFTLTASGCNKVTGKLIVNITEPKDIIEKIEYEVTNGRADYDGNETDGGAYVAVSGNYVDLNIKYGTKQGEYNLSEIPKYVNPGNYKVYFKITANGCEDTYGDVSIIINKARGKIYASATDVQHYFIKPDSTITLYSDTGYIALDNYDDSIMDVTLDKNVGATVTNPATLTIHCDTPGTHQIRLSAKPNLYYTSTTLNVNVRYLVGNMYSLPGEDFNKAIKQFIDDSGKTVTDVIFDLEENVAVPLGATKLDLSCQGDSRIYGYIDGANKTLYILSINESLKLNPYCNKMFRDMPAIKSVTFNNCDCTDIIDTSYMFYNTPSLTDVTGEFDIINVETTAHMFEESAISDVAVFNVPVATSKLKDMTMMFYKSHIENSNALVNLDCSNATTANAMYAYTPVVSAQLDIPLDKMKDMGRMFAECQELESIVTSSSNKFKSVTTMEKMFYKCPKINTATIYSSSEKLANVEAMFAGCVNMVTVDMSEVEAVSLDQFDIFGYARRYWAKLQSNDADAFRSDGKRVIDEMDAPAGKGTEFLIRRTDGNEESINIDNRLAKTSTDVAEVAYKAPVKLQTLKVPKNLNTRKWWQGYKFLLPFAMKKSDGRSKPTYTLCYDVANSSSNTEPYQYTYIRAVDTFNYGDTVGINGVTYTADDCIYYNIDQKTGIYYYIFQKNNKVVMYMNGKMKNSIEPTVTTEVYCRPFNYTTDIKRAFTIDYKTGKLIMTYWYQNLPHFIRRCFGYAEAVDPITGKSDYESFAHYFEMSRYFGTEISQTHSYDNVEHIVGITDWSDRYHTAISEIYCDVDLNGNQPRSLFNGMYNVRHITFGPNFNTSTATDFNSMFRNCDQLLNIDVEHIDTSNATDMRHMFDGCYNCDFSNISLLNTSSAKDLRYIFRHCEQLKSDNLEGLTFSNDANVAYMFAGIQNMHNFDCSDLNLGNVEDIDYLYADPEIEAVPFRETVYRVANPEGGDDLRKTSKEYVVYEILDDSTVTVPRAMGKNLPKDRYTYYGYDIGQTYKNIFRVPVPYKNYDGPRFGVVE